MKEFKMETLELEPCNLTEEEIKIERARIGGLHEGIKIVIYHIEKVERMDKLMGEKPSESLRRLKDILLTLVYK
jgi:hypothetical protein